VGLVGFGTTGGCGGSTSVGDYNGAVEGTAGSGNLTGTGGAGGTSVGGSSGAGTGGGNDGGAVCKLGETKPAGDGCNTCSCDTSGNWGCTEKACLACTPGQMKTADDGCNTCICSDTGQWACTKKACVTPPPQAPWCGDLRAGGAAVSSTQEASPPPDMGKGGTIVDGIYDLTKMTYYNNGGSTGSLDTETIRISGGGTVIEYTTSMYNFGMVISVAPQGSMLNDKVVCPADEPSFNMFVGPYYTASPTEFVGIGSGYVKVFTKR
jgi:hypothetical protein